jgi:transposase
MLVDWAGATIPLYDRESGEAKAAASLFVAALGASSYTFAHATLSQDLGNWIDCHIRAFEFFQGTSQLVVPDNPRTGVKTFEQTWRGFHATDAGAHAQFGQNRGMLEVD